MASTTRRRRAAPSSERPELPLREILDGAPDAVIVIDATGTIVQWNRQAEVIFGWSAGEAIGRTLIETIVPSRYRGRHEPGLTHFAFTEGGPREAAGVANQRLEMTARDREGREFPIELAMTPIRQGPRQWFSAFVRDVSPQRRADEQLRFQASILRNVRDSVIATDLAGRVEYWNAGAEEIFGYGAEEMLGRTVDVLYPEEDRARLAADLAHILAGEDQIGDWLGRRKDGRAVWVDVKTSLLRDAGGRAVGFLGVAKDITERKRAELQLDGSHQGLRDLTGRLQRVREQERAVMARRIHDELGQVLTALAMDVAWLEARLGARLPSLSNKCRTMAGQIEQAIGRVRTLATELRPAVLDDLGLVPAIEWEIQQFTLRTGVECALDLPAPAPALDSERATDVFRILQEALTNVARHAGAGRVEVRLWAGARRLELEVRDDGRGIGSAEAADRRSLGLLGMRERALRWGGAVEVGPRHGGGTCVKLTLPLGERGEFAEAG
jgi:two-component system sensor histidine kinase UhpB